ncbi:MAG: S9 family peptidase, partial [Myxococcales bacterium]
MKLRHLALLPVLAAACTTTKETKSEPIVPMVEAPKPPAKPWPETRREEIADVLFGARVADPYRWLEEEKDASVQAWMNAQ